MVNNQPVADIAKQIRGKRECNKPFFVILFRTENKQILPIRTKLSSNNSVRQSKSLGRWKPRGKCVSNIVGFKCGPGIQIMVRTCSDGTTQKCETTDRTSERQCLLGHCPKRLGKWEDDGLCIPFDNVKKCGNGKKLQKRTCEYGTTDICDSKAIERTENCFVSCKKKFGLWVEGKCISKNTKQNCGEGEQRWTRSCEQGTNDPCLTTEIIKTNTCFLGNCRKRLGKWKDEGLCLPFDNVKNCGNGNIIQTRSCENGTINVCHSYETRQTKNCFINCKKKYSPWIKGKCMSNHRTQNCGEGRQLLRRRCEQGTNDPCLERELKKTNVCFLGHCPTGMR